MLAAAICLTVLGLALFITMQVKLFSSGPAMLEGMLNGKPVNMLKPILFYAATVITWIAALVCWIVFFIGLL